MQAQTNVPLPRKVLERSKWSKMATFHYLIRANANPIRAKVTPGWGNFGHATFQKKGDLHIKNFKREQNYVKAQGRW